MIFGDRREHVCYQVEVLTFATIARAFKAMGISASFEAQGIGRIALWYRWYYTIGKIEGNHFCCHSCHLFTVYKVLVINDIV